MHNEILVLKKLYSQKYHVNSYCEFVGFYFKENERMTSYLIQSEMCPLYIIYGLQ
jgi:hypothetical protein